MSIRVALLLQLALIAFVRCQTYASTGPPPMTTTLPPTTSTIEPKSTTTEPSNTTTTTIAPPEPTPSIPPTPKQGNWSVSGNPNNTVCIKAQFGAQILIKYNDTKLNKTVVTTGFNINENATVDSQRSSCNSAGLQILVLNFQFQNFTEGYIRLTFNKSNDRSIFVNLTEVSFKLTRELLPGFNTTLFNKTEILSTNENILKVDDSHSYLCNSVKNSLTFNKDLAFISADLELTDVRVQAFMTRKNGGKFSTERNCKSKEVSDVFPIAVGIALAGLVIIVLIAYFIGRRRNRRMAYQSV